MINKKYILLSFLLILFLLNINIVIYSVIDSSILFFNKIFVSIFPFIILSDILIYYDYHIFLSNTIGKYISRLFNINSNSTIVLILSILTSQPSNSIYINNLLDNKLINEEEANRLLTYTYFPSISFVLGTIGIGVFNNIKIGLIILIINYIYNFSIGIYLRKSISLDINHNYKNNNKVSFFYMLKESINKSFDTCYLILGNLIIFSIITNIFNKYIYINDVINSIFSGLLEMTNGINKISLININLIIKIILASFVINFSGLSILFQSKNILYKYNINIKKILITKLVFSIFICLLCCCGYYFYIKFFI